MRTAFLFGKMGSKSIRDRLNETMNGKNFRLIVYL